MFIHTKVLLFQINNMITKLNTFKINESINDIDLSNIDIVNIQNAVEKEKYVEILFVVEFPDITVVNIPHYFSITNNYCNIETYMMKKELLKKINSYFKQYNIKVFSKDKLSEDSYTIIAQPINYNLNKNNI